MLMFFVEFGFGYLISDFSVSVSVFLEVKSRFRFRFWQKHRLTKFSAQPENHPNVKKLLEFQLFPIIIFGMLESLFIKLISNI